MLCMLEVRLEPTTHALLLAVLFFFLSEVGYRFEYAWLARLGNVFKSSSVVCVVSSLYGWS